MDGIGYTPTSARTRLPLMKSYASTLYPRRREPDEGQAFLSFPTVTHIAAMHDGERWPESHAQSVIPLPLLPMIATVQMCSQCTAGSSVTQLKARRDGAGSAGQGS